MWQVIWVVALQVTWVGHLSQRVTWRSNVMLLMWPPSLLLPLLLFATLIDGFANVLGE
jgi:hypothetical protein